MTDSPALPDRRRFIRDTALASLALIGLAGCTGISRRTSYIDNLVPPSDRSTVIHWTDIMLQGVRDLSLTPLQASRGFAMAHSAGSIAIGNYFPGAMGFETSELDPETAYAVAFSVALEEAWSTSFLTPRRKFLTGRRDHKHQHAAIAQGRAAADYVINLRTKDGAEISRSDFYVSGESCLSPCTRAMRWTPTGPLYGAPSGPVFEPFQRGQSPAWGWQKSWVIAEPSSYRPAPFPDFRSPEFAAQFEKVAELGRDRGAGRTREQTEIALFWEDGPRGVSNPGHFQLIAIDIARRQSWSLAQQAAFFAALSVAQADAAIVAWRSKYEFNVLRPETAIRFAGSRFPERTSLQADSGWQSYIPTPAFPSYVSGHSVFGAASMGVISRLLGQDDVAVSSGVPDRVNWPTQLTGVTRRWNSLRAIAEENGNSREFGGVHWEADNLQGLEMGDRLAAEVVEKLALEVIA